MRRAKNIFFTLIPMLPLFFGCSKNDVVPVRESGESPETGKNAGIVSISNVWMDGMGTGTKASRLDATTFSDFGLYAGLAQDSHFGPTTPVADYMNNAKVIKDWVLDKWDTQVKYYWPLPGNGTISFFPYAPYIDDSSVLSLSPVPYTGTPVLLYTPDTSASKQKDLCIAPALYDRTVENNLLSFHFSHVLTYIQFWGNYKAGASGLPSGVFIKVDRLTLRNIIGTKGITWKEEEPYFEWERDSDSNNTDYTLSRISEELTDNYLPSQPETLHLEYARGMLLLLPQAINSPGRSVKSLLDIDFSLYRQDGSSEVPVSSFNAVKELPSGTDWKPGSVIKYIFTLNVEDISEVEISVSIEDWQSSGNTDPDIMIEK